MNLRLPILFLAAIAAVLSALGDAAENAGTLVKTGQCFFPRLKFDTIEQVVDKWNVWPVGDQKLRDWVKRATNINILTDPVVVDVDHPDLLFQYPFVFMTSEGHWTLSDSGSKNLREYLLRGGFLLGDDCVVGNSRASWFYESFGTEMKRIMGEAAVVKELPRDHEIYNCFYQLDHAPYLQGANSQPIGVFDRQSGRLMALCTSGDIHCGWVGFNNLNQQECQLALQFGVNIIVYVLSH